MRVHEGMLQFLISWKGYPGQDSWVRLDCPELVDAFVEGANARV